MKQITFLALPAFVGMDEMKDGLGGRFEILMCRNMRGFSDACKVDYDDMYDKEA